MEQLLQALRLGRCFVQFMVEMSIPGVIGLRLRLVRAWWRCYSPLETRRVVWRWQAGWAERINHITNEALRATVRYDLTAEAQAAIADEEQPLFLISNHLSYDDAPRIFGVMHGRPMVWSGKWFLRWLLPATGKAVNITGTAWLKRNKSPEAKARNQQRLAEVSQRARADGASIVLFPEGHRWSLKYVTETFKKLLPPYVGGFDTITNVVPEYPILHLTMQRTPTADGKLDIVVHGRLRHLPPGLTRDQKQAVLMGWWGESEVLLD